MALRVKKQSQSYSASGTKKPVARKWVWVFSIFFVISGLFVGVFNFPQVWNNSVYYLNQYAPFQIPQWYPREFRLGLDLLGGSELVYEADLSNISFGEKENALQGVRDVIERRANVLGVAEPVVQIINSGNASRVVVQLAGIQDVKEAIRQIGETPILEFKEQKPPKTIEIKGEDGQVMNAEVAPAEGEDPWVNTALSGKDLKSANVEFDPTTGAPNVSLKFSDEGEKLFGDLTAKNIGKPIAIFLDGGIISAPTVQQEIRSGGAIITGSFTVPEAKLLAQRLNAGALPVPITLVSQQTVGATLGQVSLQNSLIAALFGFLFVALFMIIYYRVSGFFAIIALLIYVSIVLAIFKLIPVTLTLAGIAGFILSMGMAVDANVLIFERLKEELHGGRTLPSAVDESFKRAWTSIRDGNVTTLIASVILFWFSSSAIKGFALTLSIGVLVSMFGAIIITRSFMTLISVWRWNKYHGLFAPFVKKNKSQM